MLFGKWERNLKDVELLALPHYGKALEATRMAVQDPVKSMADETLMAVCLLGFYEVRSTNPLSKADYLWHLSRHKHTTYTSDSLGFTCCFQRENLNPKTFRRCCIFDQAKTE